jgi:hypothetical protein
VVDARRIALRHLARSQMSRHPSGVRVPGTVPLGRNEGPIPAKTYIVCTDLRSGSWLLSEGLASTSVAGNPREWFNLQEEQERRARWRMDNQTDLTPEGYLRLARLESMASNGISGIKLHYYQFARLPRKMEAIPRWRVCRRRMAWRRWLSIYNTADRVWTRCDNFG